MALWKKFDGEPFLVNPNLFIVNKKRRKAKKRSKPMARRLPPRNKKGRFVKRGSTARRRHSFKAKIKYHGRTRRVRVARHPVLVNPRRRRHARRVSSKYAMVVNRRRRGYRRNPNILSKVGLSMPMLKTVGFTLVGTIGTPYVEGFVKGYLPAAITGNQFGNYAVKIGSAWVVSFGVGAVAGKEASRAALIGGLAYVAVGVLRDFNLLPAVSTSGMGVQPLLGRAAGARGVGAYNTPITAEPSGRLDPASRF